MSEHTYGLKIDGVDRCPLCPGEHGGAGPCDLRRYSARQRRFVEAHLEAYVSAYENPDRRAAANEMERLGEEYKNDLPGHDCTCRPSHCYECLKISRQRVNRDSAVEIGRTAPVNAPAPLTTMLDYFAGYMRGAA